MEASFCPFDMSKANSKISCVVVKEQRVVKLSVNLSRGCFFPPVRGVSVSEVALKHVCDSVVVDSVIYPYMLWSSAPRGLALAYWRVTLLVLYKEKNAILLGPH